MVLWTRLTPTDPRTDAVPVVWRVATDPALRDVVVEGTADAAAERDFTVAVQAEGLQPGTTYWYRFDSEGVTSPAGRTRTTPVGPTRHMRIGVVCCAHWTAGFFNAYGNLARRDVDLVVHLGDYIYEGRARDRHGVRLGRPPVHLLSQRDYRARHAQYKTDPDLRALHAAHPVVAIWDDHEVGSNCWRGGAAGHRPRQDGPWAERLAAAVGAYREWMPVPPLGPGDDPLRLWRTVRLGDLCDIVLLDTRLPGRDRPVSMKLPTPGVLRRDRSLLDDEQWRWLEGELLAPERTPRWRLLGSQVVVAPIHLLAVPPGARRLAQRLGATGGGLVVNPGQWDGYPDERDRLYSLLARSTGQTFVVSGDLHSSWANELRAGDGTLVASELTAPAVSAPDFAHKLAPPIPGGGRLLEALIRGQNPHIRWVDTQRRGYLVLDLTPERVEAEWWHVDAVDRRTPSEHCAARFTLSGDDGAGGALLEPLELYSSSRRSAATKAS